jgi:hypothetical protein
MPKETRKRWTRRSAAEIERLLDDLDASGLSQQAFAERRGIPLSTLTWWRRRRGRSARPRKLTSPSLLPVVVTPGGVERDSGPKIPGGGFEVELRSGDLLRIPVDFDAAALERLVVVLDRRC